MAYFINALSTAVMPYVMPVVERNLAPDFLVRFGECLLFLDYGRYIELSLVLLYKQPSPPNKIMILCLSLSHRFLCLQKSYIFFWRRTALASVLYGVHDVGFGIATSSQVEAA